MTPVGAICGAAGSGTEAYCGLLELLIPGARQHLEARGFGGVCPPVLPGERRAEGPLQKALVSTATRCQELGGIAGVLEESAQIWCGRIGRGGPQLPSTVGGSRLRPGLILDCGGRLRPSCWRALCLEGMDRASSGT